MPACRSCSLLPPRQTTWHVNKLQGSCSAYCSTVQCTWTVPALDPFLTRSRLVAAAPHSNWVSICHSPFWYKEVPNRNKPKEMKKWNGVWQFLITASKQHMETSLSISSLNMSPSSKNYFYSVILWSPWTWFTSVRKAEIYFWWDNSSEKNIFKHLDYWEIFTIELCFPLAFSRCVLVH